MAAGEFLWRLRAKYEQWVHVSRRLPVEPHERRIAGTQRWAPLDGTLCGHMRPVHVESHRPGELLGAPNGPTCGALDCGDLLGALKALHARRPFGSFVVAAGGNCSHCLPALAPTLLRTAERIESGHTSRHIVEKVTFDDEDGAMADMRALSRCAVVIVDDRREGTVALPLAAAGRLAPCADALAWLERRQPGYGPGGHFARVKGTVDLARWHARASARPPSRPRPSRRRRGRSRPRPRTSTRCTTRSASTSRGRGTRCTGFRPSIETNERAHGRNPCPCSRRHCVCDCVTVTVTVGVSPTRTLSRATAVAHWLRVRAGDAELTVRRSPRAQRNSASSPRGVHGADGRGERR
jgi:hypothetical protein